MEQKTNLKSAKKSEKSAKSKSEKSEEKPKIFEEAKTNRDDIRRTTRIIQIDEMLRGGSFIKLEDLIFKFGVNKRTIERDFERLRDDLNAPLEYDKAKKMYHYTDPTFSIPNVVLTEGELFTMSTLLPLMEQYKNTPLETSFRNIMAKISGLLPEKVSVNSSFLNRDISFISDPLPKIDSEVFNAIFKAVRSRKVVSFDYKSVSSAFYKSRIFDAYNVLCQKGNWYVLGFDHKAQDFRVFALARMKNILFTNETFKIQDDFDLKNHVDLDLGIWNNKTELEEYEILFSKDLANYIMEREWHKDQILEQKEDGSVLLKFTSNQKEMIFSWILSFGYSATVLKPERLRAELKAECLKVLGKYDS